MPSLPRIRTRRVGQPVRAEVAPRQPRLAELHGDGLTWIHLDSPTHEEAQQLAERFGWHPLDIEDVLSRRQRPKVDLYSEEPDGYLFAVLHFPVYDTAVGRLNAGELDVFVGADYLVTLPAVELKPVSRLFQRCYENADLRHNLFSRGSGRLLYEVLDDLYDYCFPILDKIELKLYFDDIVDASERIWDLLDNYKEVVEALEDTNESLISHQQNDILYVLTIFSVVMLPLTFLTGFFGMNVNFPGFDTTGGFIVSLVLSLAAIVGMLGFFRWKRWL